MKTAASKRARLTTSLAAAISVHCASITTVAFAGGRPGTGVGTSPAPLTVRAQIDWNQRRQSIDGFGASSDYFVRDFAAFPKNKRKQVLDALFDTTRGAGLSIVRSRIWDGSCDGPSARCRIKPTPLTHNPAPGVWEFDCPPVQRDGRCVPGQPKDQWQIWFAREAKRRAKDVSFIFSVWSPPGWMKDTGRPEEGGRLLKRFYPAYADYLSRNVREYASRYDIKADVLSVQNEPGLAGPAATTLWTPEELREFVKDHLGPRFVADRVTSRIMVAEDQYWGEMSAKAILADPDAARYVGVFGGHNYNNSTTPFGGVARRIDLGAAAGRPVWMTEVSRHGQGVPFDPSIDDALGWAKSIHEFMTVADASAWLYWRFQRPGGSESPGWPAGGKEMLISMVPETGRVETAKRLWAMGNYSRFIRPGFVRVAATAEPAPGVHLSAYRQGRSRGRAASSFAVVVVNENENDVAIELVGARATAAHRTSATENLVQIQAPRGTRSRSSLYLAPRSITTFTGRLTPTPSADRLASSAHPASMM